MKNGSFICLQMGHFETEQLALFQSAPFASRWSFIFLWAKSGCQSQGHGGGGRQPIPLCPIISWLAHGHARAGTSAGHRDHLPLLLPSAGQNFHEPGSCTARPDHLSPPCLCLHAQTYLHCAKGLVGCSCCWTLSALARLPPLVLATSIPPGLFLGKHVTVFFCFIRKYLKIRIIFLLSNWIHFKKHYQFILLLNSQTSL